MTKSRRSSSGKSAPRVGGPGTVASLVQSLMPVLQHHEQLADACRKIYGALLARQYDRAVEVAEHVLTQSYENAGDSFLAAQLAGFVRKVPFIHAELKPEQTAVRKFWAAEHRCRRVNQKLRAYGKRPHLYYKRTFELARSFVRQTLGEIPDLGAILSQCGFGPGASVGVHGNMTSYVEKLGYLSVTPSCAPFARIGLWAHAQAREQFLQQQRGIACLDYDAFVESVECRLQYVVANKITFVPKTAKTHRSIAIEPTLNGFVQKGIDVWMRRQLLRMGIDLSDQALNQRLARWGTLGGVNPWSTIDLSAASDSLATELVRLLIPPEWFEFLAAVRSPCFELGGQVHRYEKFTSMGNGFCFPLETLIFASLAYAAGIETGNTTPLDPDFRTDGTVRAPYRNWVQNGFSVYGDDIIVHQSQALITIEYLGEVGFKTNRDKTFVFGPFRESCGADYFEGHNVRPFILDEIPSCSRDFFKILNGLRDVKYRFLATSWESIFDSLPESERLVRPCDGPPDSAITVPLDMFMSSRFARWSRELQTWQWTELLSTPITEAVPEELELFGALQGSPSQDYRAVVAYRRKTRTRRRVVPSCEPTHSFMGGFFMGPLLN